MCFLGQIFIFSKYRFTKSGISRFVSETISNLAIKVYLIQCAQLILCKYVWRVEIPWGGKTDVAYLGYNKDKLGCYRNNILACLCYILMSTYAFHEHNWTHLEQTEFRKFCFSGQIFIFNMYRATLSGISGLVSESISN